MIRWIRLLNLKLKEILKNLRAQTKVKVERLCHLPALRREENCTSDARNWSGNIEPLRVSAFTFISSSPRPQTS